MNHPGDRPRVLLLMTPTTYRAADFLGAAEAAGVDIVVGTNLGQVLAGLAPDHNLTLPFDDPEEAARRVREYAARCPLCAVVGVDDEGVLPAARLAAVLDLPHNSVAAVGATRSKAALRQALLDAGLPGPPFLAARTLPEPDEVGQRVGFPCVVKPAALSGSRGVLRVDDACDLPAVWARVVSILQAAQGEGRQGIEDDRILIEGFIPGQEVALEALLDQGELHPLALFDKPDPMDGPAFAETLFITPSRLPGATQAAVLARAREVARVLGLRNGPVHAEFRVQGAEVHLLEMAARTIGGLCARTLRFGIGMSLEEIVLRHACHLELPSLTRQEGAAGVFMVPVSAAGTFMGASGLEEARQVPGVLEVVITIPSGEKVRPLPEESTPLGFIFARGERPEQVEATLREAGRLLSPGIVRTTA